MMKKTIPLHSMIVIIGMSETHRKMVVDIFPKHEILSENKIRDDLIGNRDGFVSQIYMEMRRRASVKLGLGERVVIDAQNFRKHDRIAFASLAKKYGSPIFYILCSSKGLLPSD